MANKITKAQMFNMIKKVPEVAQNSLMVEFIEHELELLEKKSASKKPTKVQEANVGLKQSIVETLASLNDGVTVSEIIKANKAFDGLSNQKVSALVNQLVAENKVKKDIDKNKSVFSLVA